MDFGDVIRKMKEDDLRRFARRGWNGKGIYIQLQNPDEGSANTLPYIYMVTSKLVSDNPDAPRGRVPWLASQTDMLAEDWEELEAEQEAGFPLTFREAINAMIKDKTVESEVLPGIEQRLSEVGFVHRGWNGKGIWWHSQGFSEVEASGKWRVVE